MPRKLNVSRAFFTKEDEYLDEYELVEIESPFRDNDAILKELEALDEISEITIEAKDLNTFWEQCKARPDTIHVLEIANGDYETNDQYNVFSGTYIAYLNCWYESEPKKEIPESKDKQLELF